MNTTKNKGTPPESTQRATTPRGRLTFWAAAGVVIIVAALAVVLMINPHSKQAPAGSGPATGATAPAKPAGCDVPAGDTSATPALPKDLRWAAANGWTWPVSDTYGPTQTRNGFGVCFARSPLGAALMAVSLTSAGNVDSSRGAIEAYVMDSPGKDIELSRLTDAPGAAAPTNFAGFIVDSFTPAEAQITMVIATDKSQTGYAGIPETFEWVGDDWKLKVLDNGNIFAGDTTSPVPGQFVTWGPTHG